MPKAIKRVPSISFGRISTCDRHRTTNSQYYYANMTCVKLFFRPAFSILCYKNGKQRARSCVQAR